MSWQCPKIVGLGLKKLTSVESMSLEVEFTMDEVWDALNSCDGNKAPGSDGFNLNFFFKANWEVIKKDVMEFFMDFYRDGSKIKRFNNTFLAFILKAVKPESSKDFRLISFVGAMYKVVVKVLANHIKLVMGLVIEDFQMAFIKNHQILDSFMIAEEVIHRWRKDKVGG